MPSTYTNLKSPLFNNHKSGCQTVARSQCSKGRTNSGKIERSEAMCVEGGVELKWVGDG
jgi:hypothetical protein